MPSTRRVARRAMHAHSLVDCCGVMLRCNAERRAGCHSVKRRHRQQKRTRKVGKGIVGGKAVMWLAASASGHRGGALRGARHEYEQMRVRE